MSPATDHFNLVGFGIPSVICLIFLPIAIRKLNWQIWFLAVVFGMITYATAKVNHGGCAVGLGPYYVIVLMIYAMMRLHTRWNVMPAMGLHSAMFLTVVVPDCFKTFELFPVTGQVGGGSWADGLMKFWLYPLPLIILLLVVFEYSNLPKAAKGSAEKFLHHLRWHCSPFAK
jgi:hypothetical protein